MNRAWPADAGSMTRRRDLRLALLALLAAVGLLWGCDAVSDLGAMADGAEPPPGWSSIEGSDASKRLYYQFVDAQRRVRFVERLEDVPGELRASVGFVKLDVPPPLTPGDARQARRARAARAGSVQVASAQTSSKLIFYSADWCGACRKAKRYMTKNGIDFELRDVDDPAIREELLRKTGSRSVPVIDAGGRILTGFSPSAIDALVASRA
jgi:glutaredoxin